MIDCVCPTEGGEREREELGQGSQLLPLSQKEDFEKEVFVVALIC